MSYVLLILHSNFRSDLGTKCGREATAFADGTKLGGTSAREGKSALREELDNRECWHIGDRMTCNSGMCKVVHLGIANKNLCCKLGAHRLEMTEEEKNLGVFVDLKMTKNSQYEAALMKSMISTEIFPGEEQKVNTVTQSSAATSSGFMQLWSLLIKGHKLQMCLENNYRGILIFFFLCKNLEIIYLAKNVNAEKGYSCSLGNFREYAQK